LRCAETNREQWEWLFVLLLLVVGVNGVGVGEGGCAENSTWARYDVRYRWDSTTACPSLTLNLASIMKSKPNKLKDRWPERPLPPPSPLHKEPFAASRANNTSWLICVTAGARERRKLGLELGGVLSLLRFCDRVQSSSPPPPPPRPPAPSTRQLPSPHLRHDVSKEGYTRGGEGRHQVLCKFVPPHLVGRLVLAVLRVQLLDAVVGHVNEGIGQVVQGVRNRPGS
jgi:hypothetical protein